MSIQASSFVTLNPSYIEPEFLRQQVQASGFIELLSDGQLRTRLESDSLLVYAKQLNLRTKVASGQSSYNELPSVDILASMISTPTYLLRVGNQYDHHDVQAGGRWGYSVVEEYRNGMWQGNYQLARDACLYGFHPENGEGLVNAPGATAINLPADSFGNDTARTYDNGQMAFFLSQQILALKTATMQLGIGRSFTILGPQRILGLFEYNVVQVTQFQREGAGTASTRGTVKEILMDNGDDLIWVYDDTLIGKGNGGNDLVMLAMPEVAVPKAGTLNTNLWGGGAPNWAACTTQYCDKAAPTEIISPMAMGMTHFMMEWRISSGWAPRYQALMLISMAY
jgi:hypothetical protein